MQHLCDPVHFSLTLKNTGGESLLLNLYDVVSQHLLVKISGPSAQSVVITPAVLERTPKAISKDDFLTLAPGAMWSCPAQLMLPGAFGGNVYRFTTPGSYTVRVSYYNNVPPNATTGKDAVSTLLGQSWQGTVAAAPIVVKMLDAGPAQQGVRMALEATTGPEHNALCVTAYFLNTGARPVHIMAWDAMETGLTLLDKDGKTLPGQFQSLRTRELTKEEREMTLAPATMGSYALPGVYRPEVNAASQQGIVCLTDRRGVMHSWHVAGNAVSCRAVITSLSCPRNARNISPAHWRRDPVTLRLDPTDFCVSQLKQHLDTFTLSLSRAEGRRRCPS